MSTCIIEAVNTNWIQTVRQTDRQTHRQTYKTYIHTYIHTYVRTYVRTLKYCFSLYPCILECTHLLIRCVLNSFLHSTYADWYPVSNWPRDGSPGSRPLNSHETNGHTIPRSPTKTNKQTNKQSATTTKHLESV